MKIVLIGYSGAGKSTLATQLAETYHLPLLHLDTLQFDPGWQTRPQDAVCQDLKDFLDQHDNWVIDGNYSFAHYVRRMEEADQIIFMNFSGWTSLRRAYKRYRTYKGKTRESMATGCEEKFDWEFIRWILWDGRRARPRQRYQWVQSHYAEKLTVIRNQRELNQFLNEIKG